MQPGTPNRRSPTTKAGLENSVRSIHRCLWRADRAAGRMVCPDLPLHLGLPHRAYSAQDFVVKNLALVAVFGSMSLCLGDEPRNLALVRFLA